MRSSVLNGCRIAVRQQARRARRDLAAAPDTGTLFESAESLVLLGDLPLPLLPDSGDPGPSGAW